MPLNVRVPLPGPISYSTSIGGRRRRRHHGRRHHTSRRTTTTRYVSETKTPEQRRAERAAIDRLPLIELKQRNLNGWIAAGVFMVVCLITLNPMTILFGVVALVVTWWRHMQRWQRRKALGIDEESVTRPIRSA